MQHGTLQGNDCVRARAGPTLECEVRKVATATISVALPVAAETMAAVTCDHPRVCARACLTRVCTLWGVHAGKPLACGPREHAHTLCSSLGYPCLKRP